ncbi:hypothetical protein NQ317_002064 [Molorchus minor]|uniref:Cytochrome P450 n=1 Tax=Molorchus minor TaxID=1323400 RepID=A0ABQ9JF53_9CUCU|nr:hypothetical protein NQ317_002064 [Molorchus minor]
MITVYFLLWLLTLLLGFYSISLLVKYLRNRSVINKVPSPPGHWFWGNLDNIIGHDPEIIFDMLRGYAEKYWPIYRFNGIYITTINLLHPCDIEIVLSQMKHLSKSRIYTLLKTWLGEGLLTSTATLYCVARENKNLLLLLLLRLNAGKKWQTRRKILTPAFHFNILQQSLVVFNEETEKLIEEIEMNSDKSCIDVVPLITQMTLQSIGETAMGLGNIDNATQLKYRESVYKIGKLLITKIAKPWYRIPFVYYFTQMRKEELQTTDFLHDLAYQLIRSRENILLKEHDDINKKTSYSGRKIVRMLDILLMAKMEGSDIDLEGIREEVDTFLFEGHDTTSMAITFLLLMMANHPNIQETVSQEISDVLGTGVPTYENLLELKYTERVIKETLRLYPSVPFISRIASEDFKTFTGYLIPKGTILHMHIFDMHRDPRIYRDPLTFDPDRFLPENCQRHPFAYIPFSAGPRNCIGQKFAIMELKAVLCGILRKFSLQHVDKPSDISFLPDLVLRPRGGVKVKFVRK